MADCKYNICTNGLYFNHWILTSDLSNLFFNILWICVFTMDVIFSWCWTILKDFSRYLKLFSTETFNFTDVRFDQYFWWQVFPTFSSEFYHIRWLINCAGFILYPKSVFLTLRGFKAEVINLCPARFHIYWFVNTFFFIAC